MNLITRLKQGIGYMKSWPETVTLGGFLPEPRVIRATRFAITWMPVIAMICLTVQLNLLGRDALPLALAQAGLILSLPVQGLYWLGWRSTQPLPLPLLHWCTEVRERLVEAGCQVAPIAPQAQYQHMACLIRRAYERLDAAFWREL